MSSTSDSSEMTAYGSIGLAIFFICVGVVYLIPNTFPEGTLYVVAGVLIILVSISNAFKGITYDMFNILFATISIVIGVNKILALDIKFLPPILIVLGVIALFVNIKKLK